MGILLLNSLEIRNFRAFRHLEIEHLGRVNLIVGKNNVGKSSLLEGLYLYAHRGSPIIIREMLGARDENKMPAMDREDLLSALKYLYFGRKNIDVEANPEPIRIGPINSPDETLSIAIIWSAIQIVKQGDQTITQRVRETELAYNTFSNLVPHLGIQMGKQFHASVPIDPSIPLRSLRPAPKEITCNFIGPNGLNKEQVGQLWDDIALTEFEGEVLNSLRFVAPGVEGLRLLVDPSRERTAIVKIAGIDEPIPLRSLGNSMQRMLNIALALVSAKGGVLLIDEIENALHHGVLKDVWSFIFRLAHRFNIQVFATTHSWDCIGAFQKVAEKNEQEEGLLVRLESKKGEIVNTLFDERRLGIATREQIEVR